MTIGKVWSYKRKELLNIVENRKGYALSTLGGKIIRRFKNRQELDTYISTCL